MNKSFIALILIYVSLISFSSAAPYKILTKYDTLLLSNDKYVIFESKDFKDNEEMYFKIKYTDTYYYYSHVYDYVDRIYYKYISSKDENFQLSSDSYRSVSFSQSTYTDYDSYSYTYGYREYSYFTKYFTIKKQKSEYGENGNYIVFNLRKTIREDPYKYYVDYIENTEEDEGKTVLIIAIVIVVVVVVAVVIVIICCCIRRKRLQKSMIAQQAAYSAQAANYAVAAQPYGTPVDPTPVYSVPVPVVDSAGYVSNPVVYPPA